MRNIINLNKPRVIKMQTSILILSLSLFSTLALSNQNSQLFNDDPNQILVQYETNDVGYIPVVSKEEPYHAMRTVEVGEYIYYNEYFNHCTQKMFLLSL